MAIKPPKPGPKPGDTFLGERPVPGLGIKPKPIKPPKPGPAPRKRSGGISDPVRTTLPGKPGDLKQMPSFLRKTKPVLPRKGGK